MADRINFANKINESVQIGDELYWLPIPSQFPILVGIITSVGDRYVEVGGEVDGVIQAATAPTFLADKTFFMFKKVNTSTTNTDNVTVNSYSKSGTKGYYASVKMSTSEPTKTKLFALGSEVAVSSK